MSLLLLFICRLDPSTSYFFLFLATFENLFLFLDSVIYQSIDLFDYASKLLLLSLELVLKTIEYEHQAVKLFILCLIFCLVTAVEQTELALELVLNRFRVSTCLLLLFSVYSDKVR